MCVYECKCVLKKAENNNKKPANNRNVEKQSDKKKPIDLNTEQRGWCSL